MLKFGYFLRFTQLVSMYLNSLLLRFHAQSILCELRYITGFVNGASILTAFSSAPVSVVGCSDPEVLPDLTSFERSSDGFASFRCQDSVAQWTVQCVDNTWMGHVGNCSLGENTMLSTQTSLTRWSQIIVVIYSLDQNAVRSIGVKFINSSINWNILYYWGVKTLFISINNE